MWLSIVGGRYCILFKAAIILLSALCAHSSNNEKKGKVLVVYDPIPSETRYGGSGHGGGGYGGGGHGGGGHGGGGHGGGGHGDYNARSGKNHGGSYDETNYGGKHDGHKYTSDNYGGKGKKTRYHGVSRDGNRGHTGSNYAYNGYDDRAHADNGFKNTDGRTAYGQRFGYHDVFHDHGHRSYHKGGKGYYGNDHVKYYDGGSNIGSGYKGHNDDEGNHRSNYYNTKHVKYGNGDKGHGDRGYGTGYGAGGYGGQGYGGGGYGHGGYGHGSYY